MSTILELLEKISDTYERQARIYPALLALSPAFALAFFLYGFELKISEGIIGLLATLVIFFLIASIVRDLGKRLEPSLFDKWGGKPTTQLLRHRDKTIDSITKSRYHTFLSEHLAIDFPTMDEERANPRAADEIYQSAVIWLLDRTRDKKAFNLLFKENVQFGFRRNCLGIKPYGIAISFLSISWTIASSKAVSLHGIDFNSFGKMSNGAWISLGVSFLTLFVWVFFLTRNTAKASAFRYADMLLRACDVLPRKQ